VSLAEPQVQQTSAQSILLDAGFLIALCDRNDTLHTAARQWLRQFHGRFITVDHVITETCFFLATDDKSLLLDLIAKGWITVEPMTPQAYARVAAILRKYADMDPDLADACLVWLAETTGLRGILTVDINDFSAYRIGGRAKFDLLPWQLAS
jgi:uncharacterized protein